MARTPEADWPICAESFDSPQYEPHQADPEQSYLVIEPDGRMVYLCDSDCLIRHYEMQLEALLREVRKSF